LVEPNSSLVRRTISPPFLSPQSVRDRIAAAPWSKHVRDEAHCSLHTDTAAPGTGRNVRERVSFWRLKILGLTDNDGFQGKRAASDK